jgi:opacity protein-like surface antigen
MCNGYYDLARFDRFRPYLGAGAGLAYNRTGGISFTGNPAIVNVIEGESRWSLIAGVGIQIRERTTLDLGYPLSRHGQGGVRRLRQSGFTNPQGASTTSPPTSSRSACASPLAAVRRAARR